MEEQSSYNKMDFLILVILALLVSFIIGFNILKLIDEKLTSVTINVPPQTCSIPPIYLSLDKDSNIKQIKLNDYIKLNPLINKQLKAKQIQKINGNMIIDNFENIDNVSAYNDYPSNSMLDETIGDSVEYFGSLNDHPSPQSNSNIIGSLISEKTADELLKQPNLYNTIQDPNFNSVNNIPVLISPDPPGPNQVPSTAPSYYENRVKLVNNPDSKLVKSMNQNMNNIQDTVEKCNRINQRSVPEVNGTFDGYNGWVGLGSDSYANFTSIGKGLLTPYSSFPVPY